MEDLFRLRTSVPVQTPAEPSSNLPTVGPAGISSVADRQACSLPTVTECRGMALHGPGHRSSKLDLP